MENNEIVARVSKISDVESLYKLLDDIRKSDRETYIRKMDFTLAHIKRYANPNLTYKRFSLVNIPKKSGGTRQICIPNVRLGVILHCLNEVFKALYTPNEFATAFCVGRSIVNNAKVHIGHNYVYSIDLEDFFGSIQQARVWKRLQLPPFNFRQPLVNAIAGMCCVKMQPSIKNNRSTADYILPQGAPTSPLLSNAICDTLDRRLTGLAKRFGLCYSRYADDITFSSNHNVFQDNSDFCNELNRIIADQKFTINVKKTRLQKRGSRQEVTGLIVCEKVNLCRKYVRSIRQILYIWKWYGVHDAYSSYRKNNNISEYKGEEGFKLIILGKLNYLKMVKGETDPVYIKLRTEYDNIVNGTYHHQSSSIHFKFVNTQSLEDFESEHGRIGIAVGKSGKRYAYWKKLNRYLRFISISNSIKEFNREDLCISECATAGGGKFYLLRNKSKRKKYTDVLEADFKKSLIWETCSKLSQSKPYEFDIVTMWNSGMFDVGEYSHDDSYHYINIAETQYTGTWTNLQQELTRELKRICFDIKFINGQTSFIVKGKSIGLSLQWPWNPPYEEELNNTAVLVQAKIPKNKYPEMEAFIKSYFELVVSEQMYYDSLNIF
ncbi:MAG: RNA-directed DNA polymerase [Bacteroidales bacterium]|nr:RNA-directed DNA polymerase [Candidatus Liminaster caballi]